MGNFRTPNDHKHYRSATFSPDEIGGGINDGGDGEGGDGQGEDELHIQTDEDAHAADAAYTSPSASTERFLVHHSPQSPRSGTNSRGGGRGDQGLAQSEEYGDEGFDQDDQGKGEAAGQKNNGGSGKGWDTSEQARQDTKNRLARALALNPNANANANAGERVGALTSSAMPFQDPNEDEGADENDYDNEDFEESGDISMSMSRDMSMSEIRSGLNNTSDTSMPQKKQKYGLDVKILHGRNIGPANFVRVSISYI